MYKDTKIASTLIYKTLLPFIMRHPNGAISSLTHGSALGFVVFPDTQLLQEGCQLTWGVRKEEVATLLGAPRRECVFNEVAGECT